MVHLEDLNSLLVHPHRPYGKAIQSNGISINSIQTPSTITYVLNLPAWILSTLSWKHSQTPLSNLLQLSLSSHYLRRIFLFPLQLLGKPFLNTSAGFYVVTTDGTNPICSETLILHTDENYRLQFMHGSLSHGKTVDVTQLQSGKEPVLTSNDCCSVDCIIKSESKLQVLVRDRYGLNDINVIVADFWSVHVAGFDESFEQNPSSNLLQVVH